MYKPDPREEESGFFYVYNLKKNCSYFKIKDFTNGDPSFKFMSVCNSCFYVANESVIKIIDINLVQSDGKEKLVAVSDKQILTYKIGNNCKLKGFTENITIKERLGTIAMVETDDNQIDMSIMYFLSRQIEKGDIVFIQLQEVQAREVRMDSIVDYKFVIHKSQQHFGVALRKSGKVDFYWNYQRVNSTEETFKDISINMQNIYLRQEDGTIYIIELSWGTRIGMEVATKLDVLTRIEWSKIFFRTIANHFKLFPSFCLINTSFFLAHGKTISLFDIIKKEWVEHIFFDIKAVKVFRNEKEEHVYNLGVYLENGRINLIDSEDTTDPRKWKIINNKYTTSGTLISLSSDMEHYRMLYILTNDNGTIYLYGFTRQTLYNFTNLVEDLRRDTIIVPYFSPSEKTEFILYNKQPGDIRVYTHYWAKNAEGIDTFYLTLQKQCQISKPQSVTGTVHAAMCTSQTSPFLFLVDDNNIYKFNTQTKEVRTFLDQNVVSLQLIDNTFCYASVNKSSRRDKFGFYVYDIQQLIDNDLDNNFLLNETLVGNNGLLDFSEDNQRLSYMVDYDKIQIVPTLHRNVVSFMGMLTRDQYICTKRIKDKFIALDRRNTLTTWNIITGKLEGQFQVKIDLSTYEIYQYEPYDICYKMDWYQPRVLLIQKTPLDNMTDEQYFDAKTMKTSLDNCTPFVKSWPKKFYNFKMIEIINDQEVKEHFSFIHYFFGVGKYQRLYISDNNQYMIERLQNSQKVTLYQAQKSTFSQIKWVIVRRLSNWPMDLSECTYANYLCSPDLMYYLDFDKKQNVFIIKDTITQKTRCNIAQGLMNPNQGNIADYPKRFKWIDSNRIRIVNQEGIEKIVFIQDKPGANNQVQSTVTLEEEAYATVPLFNETTGYLHFYFLRKPLAIGDTLERLKAKYQKYKQAYFLEGYKLVTEEAKRNFMYDQLYDVDYSINGCKDKYVADLSFTYLHWRLATMIEKDQNFNLRDFDNSQVEMLVYNIFPHCNSVMHSAFQNIELIKQIYLYSELAESKFEVPIVTNLSGNTVLHLCMDEAIAEYKTAEFLLQKLALAPLDHHGRGIANIIDKFIDQGIPTLGPYLEKRFLQTEQLKQVRRGFLNKGIDGERDYACIETNIWMDINQTKASLLDTNNPIETNIRLEFFDIPKLHCHGTPESTAIFKALSNTEDINLFNNRAIQTIIDQKWAVVKEFTIWKLFLPFVIYQAIYFYYSNFIFLQRFLESPAQQQVVGFNDINFYFIGVILMFYSLYFLFNETKQLIVTGSAYFSSVWNYLDIIPPIIIPIIVFSDFQRIRYDMLHTMNAFTALTMWLKFLYFLRIFKATGYLIRMIVDVIYDMRVFFLVLMIVIVAFADSFFSLSSAQAEENRFAGENFLQAIIYSYRTGLGDFVADVYNQSIQAVSIWIIFILASILVLIVLMNLLIAIISESFNEINQVQVQASYQERARIIEENCHLISQNRLHSAKQVEQYMLIGREVQDSALNLDVLFQIDTLKKNLTGRVDTIETKLDLILTQLNKK